LKYTGNYNLKKPEGSDIVNIEDFNDNADIIDQALKAHDDELATKETPAGAQAKADAAEANAKAYTDAHEQKAAPHSGHETPAGAQSKAEAAAAAAIAAHEDDPDPHEQYALDTELAALQNEVDEHKAEKANLSALGHVNHAVLTVTLDTTWSGTSAPYTKTISVSGILATDVPFIDIVMSGTYATDTARQEAWGYIYRAVTGADSITFYATDKPTVDLPIQIRVVR